MDQNSQRMVCELNVFRLIELGPRLTLQLTKIEEGIDDGEVLYHAYITKSPKQLMQLRKELAKKKSFLFQNAAEACIIKLIYLFEILKWIESKNLLN